MECKYRSYIFNKQQYCSVFRASVNIERLYYSKTKKGLKSISFSILKKKETTRREKARRCRLSRQNRAR